MRIAWLGNRKVLAFWTTVGILILIVTLVAWAGRGRVLTMQRRAELNLTESISFDKAADLSARGANPLQPAELRLLPQKLIRNAKLSLEIQHYGRFETALGGLTQRCGYLSNIQVNQDERGIRRAEITLRVEASRFDEALAAFKRLGTVSHEEISVEDVTRSYADLEARFANKRISAARLREIIQTRAGKLSDVIEAEQALAGITEEMESMEAQKRSLDNQLSYSTIKAEVHEPAPPASAPLSLWVPILDAVKEARSALIGCLAFLVMVVIVLAPWALLILGGFLCWRRFRGRKTEREETPS